MDFLFLPYSYGEEEIVILSLIYVYKWVVLDKLDVTVYGLNI